MLYLTLKDETGDKSLQLTAENLPEMIDELKSWNDWDGYLEIFKKTKRYQADPEGEVKKERESGWYYFNGDA